MKHAILLGDPSHFRIKSGKNPYTRDRWGRRKTVDLPKAAAQWGRFKGTLESLGAKVFVLPPSEENPSTVFPANAGFLYPKYEPRPWANKKFYLSSLSPHRAGEETLYRDFFASVGLATETAPYPFEGEADFFPCGDLHLFCHGPIVRTGFRPAWDWPPYRYRFSHRTDNRNREFLRSVVGQKEILGVRLIDERYYHGDTALFAFGRQREYLFAYLEALDFESQSRLKHRLGSRLIPLSRTDAENFVANGFQLDTPAGPHLVFPEGVSSQVRNTVTRMGFPMTTVDVSEFFLKGGGSVKCLICDLGPYLVE
jgi:N-dimethylarginine dimethylaminohydrolase